MILDEKPANHQSNKAHKRGRKKLQDGKDPKSWQMKNPPPMGVDGVGVKKYKI
jgi:hypothetical protein